MPALCALLWVKWTLTWASSCYLHSQASLLPPLLRQTPPPTNTQGGNFTEQETGACFLTFTWSSRHFDNTLFHANSDGSDSCIHSAGSESYDSLSVPVDRKKKKIGFWITWKLKKAFDSWESKTLQQDCNIIVTLDYKVNERFVVRLQNKHAAFMFILKWLSIIAIKWNISAQRTSFYPLWLCAHVNIWKKKKKKKVCFWRLPTSSLIHCGRCYTLWESRTGDVGQQTAGNLTKMNIIMEEEWWRISCY